MALQRFVKFENIVAHYMLYVVNADTVEELREKILEIDPKFGSDKIKMRITSGPPGMAGRVFLTEGPIHPKIDTIYIKALENS
jgi:oxalate decarboxylase/phosphoglucose isomerase-like protein (cupin superfamily)